MIVKVMVFFLIFIVILAMFGRLRFPGQARLKAARCPSCARFRLGKGPCTCGHGGRG